MAEAVVRDTSDDRSGPSPPGAAGTPVTGAVADRNNANQQWFVLGTQTQ